MLAALPPDDRARVLAHTTPITPAANDQIYRAGGPIDHVYFPNGGVASLVIQLEDGAAVEVGTVGHEGFVGSPLVLGVEHSPLRAFWQVPGSARRMPAAAFAAEMRRDGAFAALARRYTQALLNMAAQSVACNRLHAISPRCARWLLMTHDRAGRDEFDLTQEFLAVMLGVRRASVTEAAGAFQRAGIISYRRGRIKVRDRRRLEAASCECYRAVQNELNRLFAHSDAARA